MKVKKQIKTLLNNQSGLTLIELLLVVVILSTVAFMTLSVVENGGNQIRFDDTANRMSQIRGAILGGDNISVTADSPLNGYVVDNGLLPLNINDLIVSPAGFDVFGVVTPQFDPVPDAITGINDGPAVGAGAEIDLIDPRQSLVKGNRGVYIQGAFNGSFRDGWKNNTAIGAELNDCPIPPGDAGLGDDTDTINHGWCVTNQLVAGAVFDIFNVQTYGRDGQPLAVIPADVYDDDLEAPEPIVSDDWQTNIAGKGVRIFNASGTDIDLAASETLQASLLIYVNDNDDTTELNWRRITTAPSLLNACLDGDGDGECPLGITGALPEITVNFPALVPPLNQVPVGEHLLVLVFDPDNGVAAPDDETTELPIPPAVNSIGTQGLAASRVKFYSRSGTPKLELIIR